MVESLRFGRCWKYVLDTETDNILMAWLLMMIYRYIVYSNNKPLTDTLDQKDEYRGSMMIFKLALKELKACASRFFNP